MIQFIQEVNNQNKDAILDRYQSLGWGLKSQWFRNDQAVSFVLVWPRSTPPVYPDISDLV